MDALDQKLSTEISEIKKMLISLHKHQVEDRNRRSISETASTSIQQQQQQRPPQQQPKVFEVHLPCHGQYTFYTETLLYVVSSYQNAILVRSPTNFFLTSRMIKKPTTYFSTLDKNIETVELSLWIDSILAFLCLHRLKTSRFDVMTQYFHQNIPGV